MSNYYKKLLVFRMFVVVEIIFFPAVVMLLPGCKKLVEIPPPLNTITSKQVFSNDLQATNAAASMFYYMVNTKFGFADGGMTLLSGMSADELSLFNKSNQDYLQFNQNTLSSGNVWNDNLWTNAYNTIYAANAIMEGLHNNSGVHDSVKNELTGEAFFVRAFSHFYLLNLYGDIPLVTTTNYSNTSLMGKTSSDKVYDQIVSDLKQAEVMLSADFSVGQGERIIPTKWAAIAVQARVALYRKDYVTADSKASQLIANALFRLADTPNGVFLTSSPEAIWQLKQNNQGDVTSYNATFEGWRIIPLNGNVQPFVVMTPGLLSAFEPGDLRQTSWIDSTKYGGKTNHYPKKYKVGPSDAELGGAYTEYYMVIRLAEMLLIRAEARAMTNNLPGAVADLNTIRARAKLSPIFPSNQADMLAAIMQERRIEFMSEWGHRWLDLKRTGQAATVLQPIKPNWRNEALLYPFPLREVTTDPNLPQNPGY